MIPCARQRPVATPSPTDVNGPARNGWVFGCRFARPLQLVGIVTHQPGGRSGQGLSRREQHIYL